MISMMRVCRIKDQNIFEKLLGYIEFFLQYAVVKDNRESKIQTVVVNKENLKTFLLEM